MALTGIIGPRAKDKQATSGTSVKERIRGLVVIAKAIVGKENKRMFFAEQDIEDGLRGN